MKKHNSITLNTRTCTHIYTYFIQGYCFLEGWSWPHFCAPSQSHRLVHSCSWRGWLWKAWLTTNNTSRKTVKLERYKTDGSVAECEVFSWGGGGAPNPNDLSIRVVCNAVHVYLLPPPLPPRMILMCLIIKSKDTSIDHTELLWVWIPFHFIDRPLLTCTICILYTYSYMYMYTM